MAYPSNPIYKIAKDDRLLANTSEAEDGVKLTRDGVEFYIPLILVIDIGKSTLRG